MRKPHLKVEAALFCEDLRREDNGKVMLIGVYTNSLTVPSYPAPISIGFFIHGKGSEEAQVPISIRIILGPDEIQVFGMNGTAVLSAPEKPEGFDFFIGNISMQVHKDGYLSLEIRQNSEAWEEVQRIPVLKNEMINPSSNVSEQPV